MKRQKLIDRFRNMPLKTQMLLGFTALYLLALLITTVLQVRVYLKKGQEQTRELFEQTARSYAETMESLISDVNSVSKAPLYSLEIQQALINGTNLTMEDELRINQSTAAARRGRYVILLCDLDGHIAYADSATDTAYIARKNLLEFRELAASYRGKVFFVPTGESEEGYTFCAVRQIYSSRISPYVPIGYTFIAVPRSLPDELRAGSEVSHFHVRVLNGEDSVIYEAGSCGEEAEEVIREELNYSGRDRRTVETEHVYCYSVADRNGTYRVILTAQKEDLMRSQRLTARMSVFIILGASLVLIGLVALLSRTLTAPLGKITLLMQRVREGDLNVRFRPQYRDEIGLLGESFDTMLEQLQAEMEHVRQVENEKQQVQIDALKQQINPHFLYNTMETFRMMALERDNYELSDLIACFGKMMRYNVAQINELTTVRQEIEYLDYYVRIQNARFNNRIRVNYDVEEALQEQSLLRLLLQPVVENSILHGMKKDGEERIHIHVRVFRREETCVIEIADDGTGIGKEKLVQLRREIARSYTESSDTKAVGLRNIQERIRLYYGENCGLEPIRNEDGGTLIRITLPLALPEALPDGGNA